MTSVAPVIGVLGHFADANHGDDACALAMLHHLQRDIPRARFVLFCRFPAVARTRFPFPSYPVRRLPNEEARPWEAPPTVLGHASDGSPAPARGWRARARSVGPLRSLVNAVRLLVVGARAVPAECRFLWQSYRRLRALDLLLVTGSNPIFDYVGGYWGFPVTMWKWSVFASLTRTPIAFVSVGAGPIVSKHSARLLVRALHRASYVSFRDEGSHRLMVEHGFRGIGRVYPDLAQSLPTPQRRVNTGSVLRIGINPMIVHHRAFWPESDATIHRNYIDSLAFLAKSLGDEGYQVFFYGTQKDDRVSAEEIQQAMREAGASLIPEFVLPGTVEELVSLSASADVLVTTRFHGAVFGVLTARPTIAICYQPKTREVLEQVGLGRFAFDFEKVDGHALRSTLAQLVARRRAVESQLRDHGRVIRASLQEQCAQLRGLLKSEAQRTRAVLSESECANVVKIS